MARGRSSALAYAGTQQQHRGALCGDAGESAHCHSELFISKTESFEYDQNSPIIYSIISEEDISEEDILEYFTNNLTINEIKIPK